MKNLCKSLLFGVLMVLFPVCASMIIQINHITNDTTVYAIQAAFFGLASLIGLVIYKKRRHQYETSLVATKKELLWFLPLLISEIVVFSAGIQLEQDILLYVCLILFTVFVGISEEVFFRGIIFNILKDKGIRYAVVASSILFGVLHLANLAGGARIEYTVLQVFFAFLFGVVAAQISVLSQSLLPAIIWHFSHDLIAFMTGNELDARAMIVLGFQCIVLSAYALYLNKHIAHYSERMS